MDKLLIKNTSWIILAQMGTKVISFFYSIFLARSLGVDNFGLYIVSLSFFTLVSSLSDFGISRYLVREISIDKSKMRRLISTSIFLRLSLMLVTFVLVASIIYFNDPDFNRRNLAILAVAAVIPQTVALTLDTIFASLLKFKFSAVGMIFLNIFTVITGITLVLLGLGAYGAVTGLVVGQALYALFLIGLTFWQKIDWLDIIDTKLLVDIVKGSLPYGILGIIGVISFKADTFFLSYFKGSYETGLYGAAYKFLEASTFIPMAFGTALFPVLSKLNKDNLKQVKNIYYKSILMFGLLGALITIAYILVLPFVIKTILPNYALSGDLIAILSLSIPFIFIHIPSGQVILSTNKYLKQLVVLYLGLLTTNLIMYYIAIPKLGAFGAALVTVVSEILTFISFLLFIKIRIFNEEVKEAS